MKKETKTIAQQLGIKKFPFTIKDKKENIIYIEDSNGFWNKNEYDSNGNKILYKTSSDYWIKREYDTNGKQIYFETSKGVIIDKRPKVVELSIEEIAKKLGIDLKFLKIVDK